MIDWARFKQDKIDGGTPSSLCPCSPFNEFLGVVPLNE